MAIQLLLVLPLMLHPCTCACIGVYVCSGHVAAAPAPAAAPAFASLFAVATLQTLLLRMLRMMLPPAHDAASILVTPLRMLLLLLLLHPELTASILVAPLRTLRVFRFMRMSSLRGTSLAAVCECCKCGCWLLSCC
jgi:hypothetical protein